jgi:hypothetical protein
VNRFFGFGEQRYKYEQIGELRRIRSFKAPNGNIVRRVHHEVEFSDGSIWSTRQNPFELSTELEKEIMEFIIKADSSLEINSIDPFPEQ